MRSIIFKLAFNVIKYTKVNVIAIYLIALIIEIYYFIFCKHGYVVYKKKYKKNKSKKNLFIHVITDSTISPSSKKLIDEYNNEGFYTVLINNINRNLSKLSDDFPTDVLINRPNIGRDLGAYKDGIKFFNDEKLIFSCKQLVMTNNSFVFKNNNKSSLCKLNNKLLDVYGLFISNENLRHIQSFFIFLNNKSPNFKKIINFWLNYYPFSSRFFCIKFGELGFSKFLKKNHIFYDAFITPKSFHEFNDSRKYFFPKITVDNNFSPNNLSPSHILGFSIFFKFGYFIVKKDIVSKRIYSRNHLAMILKRNHLEFLFNEFHPDNTSLIFKLKKFFLIV